MGQNEDLYRAVLPDHTHLASSRRTDGAFLGAILDDVTNTLMGQADFVKVETAEVDSERSGGSTVLGLAMGVAVGVVATIVVSKAAPSIKLWWLNNALPTSKARWRRVTGSAKADAHAVSLELAPPVWTDTADFSTEVDLVLGDCRRPMSGDEAHRRLVGILMAAAYIAEQLRSLSNADIRDDDASPQLRSGLSELASHDIVSLINRALEANARLLDDETSVEFARLFDGGQFVDGQYIPVRIESIQDALRLTNGEAPA